MALELVAASGIKGVTAGIAQVVRKLGRPLLILENPDFMLAAAGEGVGALNMADMVLDLREVWVSPMIGGRGEGFEMLLTLGGSCVIL